MTFTSSDTDPGVVLPADYTFQPGDQGVASFPGGVTLITSRANENALIVP